MTSSSPLGALWQRHRTLIKVLLGLLVLAGSVVLLLQLQPPPPEKARPIDARLELAAGEVKLKEGEAWPSVVSGVPLPSGAELATGKGARALVRLSDGSSVFLRGDSEIALGPAGIALRKGELWLDAPASEGKGLVHELGDVTVAAGDAGLSMKREGAEVVVYVARGLAVVTSPKGRVEVNAGEQVTASGGAAPKVGPVAFWDDWTGGMGDRGSIAGQGAGAGRIYGVDPAAPGGTPARTLEISRQSVRAVIRDGLAETEVDQTFSNPGGRQVEGWYWFTVPERAIVTSFAVESNGALIEGEVIEKQEAAARYQAAVRAAADPALLEWIDGKSYRARIFPVPASGSRRVVLRYLELVASPGGKLDYVYPMGSPDAPEIGEMSLVVDLGDEGASMQIATVADAVVEEGGRRVTMRRSGYSPRADFQLEATGSKKATPLRVARFSSREAGGDDRADYLMARYVPDIDWASIPELPADLVVVVDTSASADEAARQQKAAAAEATLRALSPSDHFALVALDTTPTVLHPKEGLAEASEKEIATALERLAEHATGGATDLGALFDAALGRVHGTEQPAVVYVGDGLPTSGEVSADKLGERLRRSFEGSRARFFTLAVGSGANHGLLHELSRAGGGQAFRIDDATSATSEVLRLASAIKTPTITDLAIDLGAGLDEPMITASGKVSRGDEVVLFARSHHALPATATIKGRVGGKDFETAYPTALDAGVGASLVPRLWAAEKMRRLLGEGGATDAYRGKIVELGVEYGLVTPYTSILALESEHAYAQQGIIRRRSALRGVRLTMLDASAPAIEAQIVDSLYPPIQTAMGCRDMEAAPAASEQKSEASPARAPEPVAATPPVAQAAPVDIPISGEDKSAAQTRARAGRADSDEEAPGAAATATASPKDALDAMKEALEAAAAPAAEPAAPPASPGPQPVAKPAGGATGAKAKVDGLVASELSKVATNEREKQPEKPKPIPAWKRAGWLSQCSDTARRPLAERIVMWAKRLRSANGAQDLIDRYEGARAACEVPDWRADQALLELMVARVRTEGAAETLLAHFADARETQRFVARALLRRAVDPRMAAAIRRAVFTQGPIWARVDDELAALKTPEERIARLRDVLAAFPGDPEGDIRLVRLLAEAGQKDQVLAYGRRLRDQGLMSPAVAIELGDVLASSGLEDDAIRTYSEIVEFDPDSSDSRRALGDVYLRHGWYPAAYRQYKTLVDIAPNDPVGFLRLAAAASGSGRVDEALRLQRQVAAAEGTPGPEDPRLWARLLSAARLGRLLEAAQKDGSGQSDGVARKLKELQILDGPAALVLLTWEDLDASLSLSAVDRESEKDAPIGDLTEAPRVGLAAVLLASGDLEKMRWKVRWRSDPPGRDATFALQTIVWDGKAFRVSLAPGALSSKQKDVLL